jgi:cytochrome d ubiquinol oxidase subunit II
MTGIALVIGYGLLGSTWLIMKTEGTLQERAYRLAWPFGLGTLVLIPLILGYTGWAYWVFRGKVADEGYH